MKVLGAILCGGRSRRFGGDKALAELAGIALIDHVRAALTPQVDASIACGRRLDDGTGIPDRPGPGLGPLGGLNAALHHAWANDFDFVLCVPCDTPVLPSDLRARLAVGGAVFVDYMPVIGLWPAILAGALDTFLASDARRSMRAFADAVGARPVPLEPIANINYVQDLTALAIRRDRPTPSN